MIASSPRHASAVAGKRMLHLFRRCDQRLKSSVCNQGVTTPFTCRPVSSLLRSSRPFYSTQQQQYRSFAAAPFSTAAAATTNVVSTSHDDSTNANTSNALTNETTNKKIIPFLLADIGEGILEVELLQWFVQKNDVICQFDKVCEVQSDKATVEITSRYDGIVVELTGGNVGDLVKVGEPLLLMQVDSDNGDADMSYKYDASSADSSQFESNKRLHIPTIGSQFHLESDSDDESNVNGESSNVHIHSARSEVTMSGGSNKFQASPAVRKLGTEYNIDLTTIRPSGPNGRLLKSDVMTYLKEQGLWRSRDANANADCSGDATTSLNTVSNSSPATQPLTPNCDEIIQLKGYNRLMVQTMTASLQIPHMGFSDELMVDKLLECRQEINAHSSATKISMLVLLTKAASLALAQVPTVNAIVHSAKDYQIQLKLDHNIGIAMDTPRGLVVPVVKQVQNKSLLELQEELNELKQLAAKLQLTPDHLSDGTFTLSNIGSMGCGTYMQPVLVSPQLAMGAIGSVQTLPRFATNEDGSVTSNQAVIAAKVLHVSWAGDHRFLDGATLARFHKAFKKYVEHPMHMLAHLK